MDEQLKSRVAELRTGYEAETGKSCQHFFCPILQSDERVELCKGHIIPEAFGTCNDWVPQRKDIDCFFGTVTEADFIGVIRDRSKSPFEKWLDPTLNRLHRPRLKAKGVELDHYFTQSPRQVPGQTLVRVIDKAGETLCNLMIKKTAEELRSLQASDLQIVVERDYRPSVIASVLKAAHLTMFRMLGYAHLLSPAGQHLAHILGTFFTQYSDLPRAQLQEAVSRHFRKHACMISPTILKNKATLGGTVKDNRFLACIGASEGMYAIGVLVPAGSEAFCVFLPAGEGQAIETYLGFLAEPPSKILVKVLQFCPAVGDEKPRFVTSPDEPFHIELPWTLPRDGAAREIQTESAGAFPLDRVDSPPE